MINLSLQFFLSQLDKLLNHLQILGDLDAVNEEILNSNLSDGVKTHATSVLRKNIDEKIFDYNANIISLYGYWEQYVEAVIKEYLTELRGLNSSNDIKSQTIGTRYRNSIIDLFRKINGNSPKFKHLTDVSLINAMYIGCSQKQNDYIPEAFFQSGGNYNYLETSDCLKRLGLNSIDNELKLYPSLKAYFINQGLSEDVIKRTSPATLFSKLDSMVSYRNEIAHGGSNGNNLLSIEEIMEHVGFLKSFASSVTECLNDDILSVKWSLKKSNPIKVKHFYDRLHVSELSKGTFYIDKNKDVFCFRGTKNFPHYIFVKITEMRINGNIVDSSEYLSLDSNEKVTIIFNKDVKSGCLLKFEE